jgi:hypothetical protein
MTVYAKAILKTFQLEDVSFSLDENSRRRLMAISAIPFLALAAMVAQSWLTVAIGRPFAHSVAPEALVRGEMAASYALAVLAPLSLAVLLGAGVLNLTDAERMWALALAAGAALVALGFAVTVVVMSLGLGEMAFESYVDLWTRLGSSLGLIAAGYVYCARPRRRGRRQRPAGG